MPSTKLKVNAEVICWARRSKVDSAADREVQASRRDDELEASDDAAEVGDVTLAPWAAAVNLLFLGELGRAAEVCPDCSGTAVVSSDARTFFKASEHIRWTTAAKWAHCWLWKLVFT